MGKGNGHEMLSKSRWFLSFPTAFSLFVISLLHNFSTDVSVAVSHVLRIERIHSEKATQPPSSFE